VRKRKVQAATAKASKAGEKASESRPSAKAASRRAASRQRSKGRAAAGRRGTNGKSARAATGRPKSHGSSGGGRTGGNAAGKAKSAVSSAVEGGEHALKKRVGKTGTHLAWMIAKQALRVGSKVAKKAIVRAGEAGAEAITEHAHRLPIQKSIDVAVPVDVAWEQWMEFEYFPEGAHRATEVEREDDLLVGALDGARPTDWRAEIIDEREGESFAWRSTEGSDSAGLVTFHQLSDRLTRIELNLDVRPIQLTEAAALMLHIADKRVEAELRRFKAHVELLNPDTYETALVSEDGDGGEEGSEEGDGSEEG
jgi:uncharacterized membrane protein